MSDLFWLSDAQMTRIALHFPCSRGVARKAANAMR